MNVRPVQHSDASALARLLNAIIARGGTTALEEPFSAAGLAHAMLTGPNVICCFVAVDQAGAVIGFQSLTRSDHLPDDVGDIGTFVRVGLAQKGTGSLLFAATRKAAVEQKLAAINATIRADNVGGLAFYTRQDFQDHSTDRGVPVRDGTPVDRVSKRYMLAVVENVSGAGIRLKKRSAI
jgi:L-amino acid N-acyltransferase YncA